MIRDLIIGLFITAARFAARWPQPHRFETRQALASLPSDVFEDEGVN